MRLFLLLVVFLLSFKAHSDIESEALLSLSYKRLNKLLQEENFEFNFKDLELDFSNMDLERGLGLSKVIVNSEVRADLLFDKKGLFIETYFKRLSLDIPNFKYTKFIQVKKTGLHAEVRVHVQCKNLRIDFQNWSADILSGVSLSKSSFSLNEKSLDFNEGEIFIDMSSCNAPKNIEPLFVEELRETLKEEKTKARLFKNLKETTEVKVNDFLSDKLRFLLDYDLRIDFERIAFKENSLELKGVLIQESRGYKRLRLSDTKAEEGDFLKLPENFMAYFIPKLVKKVEGKIYRKTIPGIDFLFNNRLIQFFVWSDLLNFSSTVDFYLHYSLEDMDFNLLGYNKRHKQFIYEVQGEANVPMNFSFKEKSYPYLNFLASLKTRVGLTFNSSGVEVILERGRFNVKAFWHSLMNSWRKKEARGLPWMSLILPRLEKKIFGKKIEIHWKDFALGKFLEDAKVEVKQNCLKVLF